MISLYSIIENTYSLYFSEYNLLIVKENNISIFDTNDLAVRIYRIQNMIIDGGGYDKELLILSTIQKVYCGCEIYYSSKIGKSFMLVHGLGTVIGSNVEIGDNVTIYHNVTIGTQYDTEKEKPNIGNNVIIYAGAKVIGNITIADNVVIGANSVVTKNIPSNEVWVGIPAKRICLNNSNKYKLPIGVK